VKCNVMAFKVAVAGAIRFTVVRLLLGRLTTGVLGSRAAEISVGICVALGLVPISFAGLTSVIRYALFDRQW